MARKQILLIEDDYMCIETIVDYLQILGHHVEVADSATEAVEKFTSKAFDFVFIDIMLAPGSVFSLEETKSGRYTGLKLLEFLMKNKSVKRHPDMKVALITNWRGEPKVDAEAAKYGATIFRKPLAINPIEEFIQ